MKYFFIVCWMCVAGMAVAQNRTIQFEPLEFNKAVVRARIDHKMVFLNAYTTWSQGCRSMAEQVFTQDQVADFCNASFINIELDVERGEGRELAEKYDITVFPTFLVIDKDRKEICRVTGGMDAVSFLEKLKAGMNLDSTVLALEKRYKEGDKSYANVAEYLDFLHKAYLTGQVKAVVEDYFREMEVKEICAGNNWKLFDTYVTAVDMPQMKRMVVEAATFKSLLGKEKAERKMYQVYERALTDSLMEAKVMSPAVYKKFGGEIKKMKFGKEQRAELETLLQLAYFKSCRMYEGFLKTYHEKEQYLTRTQKQNVVFTMPFFVEAPDGLKEQAIELVNQSMQNDREKGLAPQMEQVYNYALYKLKENPEKD